MDESTSRDNNATAVFTRYLMIFGAVGALLYLRYLRNKPVTSARASGRSSDNVVEWDSNGKLAAKKKAEKAKQKTKPKAVAPSASAKGAFSSSVNFDPEEEITTSKDLDLDFARQMASTKAGTKFATTKSDDMRHKSVKQSRAQEMPNATNTGKTSAPSSTTGDADDDLSPVNSPEITAVNGLDVSDMLEAPAAAPSVLRLTSTDSIKTKEKKVKAVEVALTKKQRQNRKKAEEKKAQNEQAEKERKALQESQRRAARIAEGRPAKDGSTSMPPKESAWDKNAANGASTNTTKSELTPLDTFDQKPAADTSSIATPKLASAAATPGNKTRSDSWMSLVPSEEEQMQRLKELNAEDSWNEVTSKKKGKKNKAPAESNSAQDGGESSSTPVAAPKPKAPINGANKQPKPVLSSSSSFAALTPDETTDGNDVEEEWEV